MNKWFYPTLEECPWALESQRKRHEYAERKARKEAEFREKYRGSGMAQLYFEIPPPVDYEKFAAWVEDFYDYATRKFEETQDSAWLEVGQRVWRKYKELS